MSLEEATIENTKAVKELTAVMAGNRDPVPAEPAKRAPGRPRSPTIDEVKVIAYKVRDEKGAPAAVALIKKHGSDSLGEMDKSKYAAFIAAAEVVLAAEEVEEVEEETGDPAEL